MRVSLKESRVGLRDSTTRIPFRYGTACLTRCPQATVRVVIEMGGRAQQGFSGDCLPPSWFDKSPHKDFATQLDDMCRVIACAQSVFADELAQETVFFPAWIAAHERIHRQCAEWGLPALLGSFGSSLLERAVLDAVCRLRTVTFAEALRENLFGIEPALIHAELRGLAPVDWLPARPATSILVRQTVGLGDPLTRAEIASGEQLQDGWPQAIEDYITRRGVRCFKVKVANDLERDVDRLTRFAALVERHLGSDYRFTLDGNEQYHHASQFESLVAAIRTRSELARLWRNLLVIEQPFDRQIALSANLVDGLRDLSAEKPIIIDESDGTLEAYAQAMELGYRGVSSKNCKGALKSVLNAGLTWLRNDRGRRRHYVMTGEDLCTVGVIPVQSDLALVASLGLEHVERNGHHYHPGLTYLPEAERRAALARHPDFYTEEHGIIGPRIVDGRFQIGSLQCVGFGFAVQPDMASMKGLALAGPRRAG